jgi:hypothetical protein
MDMAFSPMTPELVLESCSQLLEESPKKRALHARFFGETD